MIFNSDISKQAQEIILFLHKVYSITSSYNF